MNIRGSKSEDMDSIYRVHDNAFGEPEGKFVARLACDILVDESAKPLLSLVAEDNGEIIANIMFSSIKIVGNAGCSAYIHPCAVSGVNSVPRSLDGFRAQVGNSG